MSIFPRSIFVLFELKKIKQVFNSCHFKTHLSPPHFNVKKKKKSKKYFWIITTDLFKVFARTRQNWLVTLKNTWYGFLSGQPGSWNHKGISTKCCYSLMSRRRESMENISWSCTALGIFFFFHLSPQIAYLSVNSLYGRTDISKCYCWLLDLSHTTSGKKELEY